MEQARISNKRVKLDHTTFQGSGPDATAQQRSNNGSRATTRHKDGQGGEKREERGGQAFSVPDLPLHFDGVPLDGGQYLAQVRRQAASHAPVYRVTHNPYAFKSSTLPSHSSKHTVSSTNQPISQLPTLPSSSWRQSFTRKFSNTRTALHNPPTSLEDLAALESARDQMPGESDQNEGTWFKWIFGYGMRARKGRGFEGAGGGAGQGGAKEVVIAIGMGQREPKTAVLKSLEHEDILRLLEHIPDWISHPAAQPLNSNTSLASSASNSTPTKPFEMPCSIPPLLSRWTFALLCFLSAQLDGNEISTLRTLARSCAQAIARSRLRYRIKLKSLGLAMPLSGGREVKMEQKDEEEEADMQFSEEDDEEEGEFDDIAFLGSDAPMPASSPASSRRAAQSAAAEQSRPRKDVGAKRSRAAQGQQSDTQELEGDRKGGKAQSEEENEGEGEAQLESFTELAMQAEKGSWIIIAAVCCGWGQSDLWEEIKGLLERS